MRVVDEDLAAHFASGATSICRCWKITRRDGVLMGFTDHDRNLSFDGVIFRAESGLDAAAVQSSTGLSVDNSAAIGVLSDLGLDEGDIRAGRFDGAEICAFLVNWAAPAQRLLQFRGSIGEIRRSGGVFEAEVRGLTEALNQPQGRAFHRQCSAVLGDAACGVDLELPGFFADVALPGGRGRFVVEGLGDFEPGWFERGRLVLGDGPFAGLFRMVKSDRLEAGSRVLTLWEPFTQILAENTSARVFAGCDKSADTCRLKFHNFLNFRGFPHIPGEDWAMTYPTQDASNDGGSLG